MSANAPPPPSPEIWQAQYLRLIAFPAQPAFEHSRGWWRELIGADPQTSTERRQRLEREDSGSAEGITLSLAVDLVRVHWTASLVVNVDRPPDGFPVIGNFLEKREWFCGLMAHWLAVMGRPIKRLAFAGTLVAPVANRRSAYELLDQYLRYVEVDPVSTDLLYRVNRPVPLSSVVDGLLINRLVTWAATSVAYYQQVLGPEAIEPPQRMREDAHGVLLEFDVNTVADRQEPLPQDRLGALLTELTDLARDLARDGDRRP